MVANLGVSHFSNNSNINTMKTIEELYLIVMGPIIIFLAVTVSVLAFKTINIIKRNSK